MRNIDEIQAALRADVRASTHIRVEHRGFSESASGGIVGDVANRIVQGWGFQAINPRSWSQVDSQAASRIAKRLLCEDLAYKSELLSENTAAYYATELIAALSSYKAKFLCNAEFTGASVLWDPIGNATFEVALVGFDENTCFLLYAQAED